jgi:hypothetical protein
VLDLLGPGALVPDAIWVDLDQEHVLPGQGFQVRPDDPRDFLLGLPEGGLAGGAEAPGNRIDDRGQEREDGQENEDGGIQEDDGESHPQHVHRRSLPCLAKSGVFLTVQASVM